MIILYGAGKDFERLMEDTSQYKNKSELMVIDSCLEKYPKGVLGHVVYGPEKLKEISSDDYVYITDRKSYDEILSFIKSINPDINICGYNAAIWQMCRKNELSRYIALEDNYEIETDVGLWLKSALDAEVGYWDKRIPECMSKNDIRFSEREFIYEYNPEIAFGVNDKILDIGCGPLPKFGSLINGRRNQYIPVDPLAYQYRKLLRKYDISLPIESKFAIMELMTSFYEENSIDYVIINNALDHCIDILRAFIESFNVLKLGGYLLLEHCEAEGLHNNYEGLHQWNITCTDNDLIFFNANGLKVNITKMFEKFADIEIKRRKQDYRDLIIVKILKKKNLPLEMIDKYDDKTLAGQMIDKLFEMLLLL